MEREAPNKHEFWAGEVFAMAGASYAHNLIVSNLIQLIGAALRDSPCVVLPSDLRVHVPASKGYVYPDLSIVCGGPDFLGEARDVIANPRVIVEVLSESTERFDRGDKFSGYRSLPSLSDYLLVGQTRARVEHYAREDESAGWLLREHGPGSSLQLSGVEAALAIDEIYRHVEFQAG